MKIKIFPLVLVCVVSLSLFSCSSNSPKSVAEKFLNSAFVNTNMEEAKKYCEPYTKELIDQATYLKQIPDSVKAEAQKTKIDIVEVKENGDKAVVVYTSSRHPENQQLLSMIKVEGKWLVQYDKAQQVDEPMPDMPELAPADSTINVLNVDTSAGPTIEK